MLITDHINLMWRNPLIGRVWDGEERFPDMSSPYDPGLCAYARATARENGLVLHEGVYVGVTGPSYETPAEVRMLGGLGASAVGMSTVPEVITARANGLRVVGISTISNYASGLSGQTLSHQEVLESGKAVSAELEQMVRGVIGHIGAGA
jgi:purine-nucleoside phosphorylase